MRLLLKEKKLNILHMNLENEKKRSRKGVLLWENNIGEEIDEELRSEILHSSEIS